jgi:hypothetical protein
LSLPEIEIRFLGRLSCISVTIPIKLSLDPGMKLWGNRPTHYGLWNSPNNNAGLRSATTCSFSIIQTTLFQVKHTRSDPNWMNAKYVTVSRDSSLAYLIRLGILRNTPRIINQVASNRSEMCTQYLTKGSTERFA